MSESIRYVIFDLDGVLLDTEPLYTEAMQNIVSRYGKTFDMGLKLRTMGRDPRLGAQMVIEALGLPLTAEALLEERRPILRRLMERAPEKPGARALVDRLRDLGIPMAVATSSSSWLQQIKLARHPWFDRFDAIVCGDDPRVGARKPAPDLFLVAAGELGADPARTLVVEDSPAGVDAARNAGMRVVALVDPNMDRTVFRSADSVIDSFDELVLEDFVLQGRTG